MEEFKGWRKARPLLWRLMRKYWLTGQECFLCLIILKEHGLLSAARLARKYRRTPEEFLAAAREQRERRGIGR